MSGPQLIHHFVEAYTGTGFHSFYPGVFRDLRAVIVLEGGSPGLVDTTLRAVLSAYGAHGAECFHSPVWPRYLTGIRFIEDQIGMAVQSALGPHPARAAVVRLGPIPPAGGQHEALRRAVNMLRTAMHLQKEWDRELAGQRPLRPDRLRAFRRQLRQRYLRRARTRPGAGRHYFGSALTAEGPRHFLDAAFSGLTRRLYLTGSTGAIRTALIRGLAEDSVSAGYDVTCYHCGLIPDRIDHVVVPDLKLGISTITAPHIIRPRPGDHIVDTNPLVHRLPAQLDAVAPWVSAYQQAYTRAWQILQSIPPVADAPNEASANKSVTRILAMLAELNRGD